MRKGRHPADSSTAGSSPTTASYDRLKATTLRDDNIYMSDLSNLLGDVYGDHHSPDAAVRREPSADQRAPAWSSESQLDRAFEGWVPGEPPSATRPEPAPPGDDLAAALAAALSAERHPEAASAAAAPAPAPAPAPAATEPVAMPSLSQTLNDLSQPAAESWTAPTAPTAPPAPAAPAPAAAPFVAPAPAPAAAVPVWTPGDDDIFPMGRGGKAKKVKSKKK